MKITDRHSLIEEVLDARRDRIGADFDAYRNHVYRVFHFATALAATTPGVEERIAVASAFHDIGIWTDGTLDYLGPSAERARSYLEEKGHGEWAAEVSEMIVLHHKLRSVDTGLLVEAFRRADLVDVSLGLVRFGLPAELVRDVRAAFPNRGFHAALVRLLGGWVVRHPTNPIPMYRW